MPFMPRCNIVNGEDNFIYFIVYGSIAVNFKISLFDIIPSEIYEINKE